MRALYTFRAIAALGAFVVYLWSPSCKPKTPVANGAGERS